jgi:Tfp pilus assembly protein PilN
MQTIDARLALLPQEAFFVKIEERPAGLSDKDIGSFAETQLEAFSPLPVDVLRWGVCAGERRIMYYAASADRLSRWKWVAPALEDARAAFPIAPLLWRCKLDDGWNVFRRRLDEASTEYAAVKVADGEWKNFVACSQFSDLPVAHAVEKLSLLASEKIAAAVWDFSAKFSRFDKLVVTISKDSVVREFNAGGAKFLASADIRDSVSLRNTQRKILYAKAGSMLLNAAAIVLAGCILWQLSFLWQNSRQDALDRRLELIQPDAKAVMLLSADAAFLDGINSKKMHNVMMLARINALRPDGVAYAKTVATGSKSIERRGKAQTLAVLNNFETALKSAAFIKNVEKKVSSSQKEGSAWTMNIEFKD